MICVQKVTPVCQGLLLVSFCHCISSVFGWEHMKTAGCYCHTLRLVQLMTDFSHMKVDATPFHLASGRILEGGCDTVRWDVL